MAPFHRGIVITLFICSPLSQAAIILPNFGNLTYVGKRSDVTISWTFTDPESEINGRSWEFSNTSEPDFKSLGFIDGTGSYKQSQDLPFTNIEGTKTGTLIIKNINLDHNGTYRFILSRFDNKDAPTSDVLIIIEEQPTAVINCSTTSTVNKDDDFICLCKGEGGNPPATATWSKDGTTLGTGYLEALLSLKNVRKTGTGSYTCRVVSHDLSNQTIVKLTVNFGPTKEAMQFPAEDKTVAVLNKQFTITCNAEGSPKPTYKLFHNDSELTAGVNGGKYTISSVNYTHAGEYKCVAKNSLGSAEKSFTLTVTVPSPEKKSGLGTGAIVGIVVGVLFLILLVLFLVWWFKFRDPDGRKNRGDSHQGMNEEPSPGPSRNQDENAYETPGTRAGTSRSSNQPSAAKSDMPPVYSQVDKSKKTKKPPPTASPALTYAALDPVALQPDSSKMRERPHEETQYADINLEKLQGDLV